MDNRTAYTEHRLKVARTARWGLLGTLGPATQEVWIVLHGYAQLASEFAASAEWPQRSDLAIVFPEALQRFYAAEPFSSHAVAPVGASWMTRDGRLDDIADNHAYLDAMVDAVHRDAPAAAVSVMGFSQGAATGARWAEERAIAGKPLRRLVVWAALMPPEVSVTADAPVRATPLTIVWGSRDKWVSEARLRDEMSRLETARLPVQLVQFEGGHRLDNDTLRAVLSAL